MSLQSIRASKAALEADIRALAARHPDMGVAEFVAIARQSLHCTVDAGFARELLNIAPNRPAALEMRAPFYIGKPCRNGHSSGVRYTSTRACRDCVNGK